MRALPLSPESLEIACDLLQAGGVVVHPTETCYGLACDLTNPTAVVRLFTLKKRPLDQPISALFSSIEEVKQYVLWDTQAKTLAKKYLPGPLTLILPLRANAPYQFYTTPPPELLGVSFQVLGRTDYSPLEAGSWKLEATIGIRISSHPIAQELVQRFGRPLSTTSANIHGQPAPYSPEEITSQFPDDLPGVLLLDGGPLPHCPPSTIIDLTGSLPREVRRGNTLIEMTGGWGIEHARGVPGHDPQ